MNQINIGNFIATKRKELNMTQAQLAEKLGVSNKTISKWETGKCMPDYSIIQELCKELNVSVAELMDGEEEEKSIRCYDQDQVLELIRELQQKEAEKKMIVGIFIMVIGIIFIVASVWVTLVYKSDRLFMVAMCWIYALIMFLIGLVRVITASKRKISLVK